MKKVKLSAEIISYLNSFGFYEKDENCLYLNSNESLKNKKLVDIAKKNKIKLQLELFS